MVQQNQSATVAIQANIQEHQAMKYRQQIEQAIGSTNYHKWAKVKCHQK